MSEAPDPFAEPKALAAKLRDTFGMSTGYASDLANGKRIPSLEKAAEIEAKLGIAPSEWVRRHRERQDAA